MKTLNQNSTAIFCRLIELMNGNEHLKITNDPFMPLTIEKIGEDIITPIGVGCAYSLCHYYEQNGDLMQDPEMCFLILDNRADDVKELSKVTIAPFMFQQANLGIYQESIEFANQIMGEVHTEMQADHAEFADMWLGNIKLQGFLK
ncbi:hypothetical protein BDD43_0177 [Mucilaginibacter gracilis]|uniref:DUF6908 domain-containing protein n=1 Tax=Mucilaginibacter gracilis TaxID=423350 RepID=A0A495IVN6_9SPHI|nr:hypothetical protein [Mucilaginibacter gracilis]RKR80084.1 hypothetical protein BDD43_0177 [Mucilaginibacter gracilis]